MANTPSYVDDSVTTVSWPNCTEIRINATTIFDSWNELYRQPTSASEHFTLGQVLDYYCVPFVALFGLLGNSLNLAVLTRKRLRRSVDRLERSAHTGLVALAVADALVCLSHLLVSLNKSLAEPRYLYRSDDVPRLALLFLDVYREALISVFVLASTWLTVVMAVERYVAVCRPLHARGYITPCGTRVAIALVFVGAVLANGPRFATYFIETRQCSYLLRKDPIVYQSALECDVIDADRPCVYYKKGTNPSFDSYSGAYKIVYFVLNVCVPLPLMTFCNVCLILALRRSRQLQQQQQIPLVARGQSGAARSATESSSAAAAASARNVSSSHNRLTRTLVGLVALFVLLVGPSEVLGFFEHYVNATNYHSSYKVAVDITNFLQLINFAVNFVLYCIVNVNFRRTCWELATCYCCRRDRRIDGVVVGGRGTNGGRSCAISESFQAGDASRGASRHGAGAGQRRHVGGGGIRTEGCTLEVMLESENDVGRGCVRAAEIGDNDGRIHRENGGQLARSNDVKCETRESR